MSDKPSPPLVQDDRVVGTHVYVGTNVWFNHWLTDPKIESFRYECPEGSFTARRRKGDYWNAYRKVKGKLRQEYLGKSPDLTQTKLIETARTLAMDNTEYWRMKYPRPEQPSRPSQESTGLYNQSAGCITETQEAGVDGLKEVIAKLKTEIDQLKEEKYDLDFENSQLREEVEKLKKQSLAVPASLAEAKEEILRLLPFERDNDFLRAINQDLKEQLATVTQSSELSVDTANLFNQLRPLLDRLSSRERRAVQQKLEEILG